MRERGRRGSRHLAAAFFGLLLVAMVSSNLSAQELVPAAYTPAPYGVNLVSLAMAYNDGGLAFDPSVPVEDVSARITSSAIGYARTFNLAGRSANVGVIVPYVVGHLEGLYLGEPATADRSGLGDIGARLAVNLYGAPAMSMREFQGFRPRTMIGASLIVRGPTGQYDSSKLVNIGSNRWSFKPEVGFVHITGRWAIDAYLGGWFFTDNTDFFDGQTRAQDPMVSTEFHVRYLFRPGLWASLDANFWRGGRTTVDGVVNDDWQANSRVGATVSIALGSKQSLRLAVSRGAITRIGGDFKSIGVSYGYSWINRPRSAGAP